MDSATHDLMREGEDVYDLAQQDGLLTANTYLAGLSGNHGDTYYADGFGDATNVVERMVTDARAGQDPYTLQQASYDTGPLLDAAAGIRTAGILKGIGDAIEAIREYRDEEAANENEEDYLAGIAAAAAALVEKFGVDPDPDWRPADAQN